MIRKMVKSVFHIPPPPRKESEVPTKLVRGEAGNQTNKLEQPDIVECKNVYSMFNELELHSKDRNSTED